MSTEDGFAVEPEQIRTCAADLHRIRERAADILELAEDANPDWYIWGAAGAPLAAIYWRYADDLHRHLRMMGEALDDKAEALTCTADAYEECDQQMANAFRSAREQRG